MDRLMSPKMTELLKKAAKTFKDGGDPFSIWWLSEHKVTADQCMSMSDIIGSVVEWFADQGPNMQVRVLLRGFHPEIAREVEHDSSTE